MSTTWRLRSGRGEVRRPSSRELRALVDAVFAGRSDRPACRVRRRGSRCRQEQAPRGGLAVCRRSVSVQRRRLPTRTRGPARGGGGTPPNARGEPGRRRTAGGNPLRSSPRTPALESVRIFEAAHRAARPLEPALLTIDDLQWVDERSLALCHYLVRAARDHDQPLTIFAAARSAGGGREFLGWLEQALRRSASPR